MVTLMVTGWVPNALAAFIACLLLGATRCITLDSAYKSIQWPSLILIIGMMPFSTALQKTGGVELAAQGLLHLFGQAEPRLLLTALFALTALIGLFVSNTATAVLMAPIALTVAQRSRRVAVSIRDDRRARRVGRVHDAGLIAGEYARARAGADIASKISCASAFPSRSLLCSSRFSSCRGCCRCGSEHKFGD